MREPFRRAFAIALFTAGALLVARIAVPERSSAGSLSAAIIGMFPKQVGEFAYADLKAARNYSWFPQLRRTASTPAASASSSSSSRQPVSIRIRRSRSLPGLE